MPAEVKKKGKKKVHDNTYNVTTKDFLKSLKAVHKDVSLTREQTHLQMIPLRRHLINIANYLDKIASESLRKRLENHLMDSPLGPQIVHVRHERFPPYRQSPRQVLTTHSPHSWQFKIFNRSDHYVIGIPPGFRYIPSLSHDKEIYFPWTYFDIAVQLIYETNQQIMHEALFELYSLEKVNKNQKQNRAINIRCKANINAMYFSDKELTKSNYTTAKVVPPWLPNIYMGGAYNPNLKLTIPVPCVAAQEITLNGSLNTKVKSIDDLFDISDKDIALASTLVANNLNEFFGADFNSDNLYRVRKMHSKLFNELGYGSISSSYHEDYGDTISDIGDKFMTVPIENWAVPAKVVTGRALFKTRNPRSKRGQRPANVKQQTA